MKSNTPTPLSSRLDSRLTAYAAVATAALAAPALPESSAAIVYVDRTATPISVPATGAGIYINLVTGTSGISPVAGWDLNPYGSTGFNMWTTTGTTFPDPNRGVMGTGTGSAAAPQALGTIVGASGPWAAQGVNSATAFTSALGVFYAGIRFTNEATGGISYGWVRYAFAGGAYSSTNPMTITGWAFESTPGASIAVGAVPEPSTYALFSVVAGALGLRAWRRRKVA